MNRVNEIIKYKEAHKAGFTGKGIGVAVMDTGIVAHKDFTLPTNRLKAFHDFVNQEENLYDDNGHGTHVAGIIGGNGYASQGLYCGLAPQCHIIALKVLTKNGNGTVSSVLEAVDWIIKHKERYNIRIVNISVGTPVYSAFDEDTRLIHGVNRLWDHQIVVVAAAGNNGPKKMSITTPGISRKIITVGASEISNYNKNQYSGRGPTKNCIVKPEVVAPGNEINSCGLNLSEYVKKSGTSMATPIVSGAIALLLEKEPNLTPMEVKLRLHDTVKNLGYPKNQQGWGRIEISKLLRL
ncbi:MAG: S8 family peptidase [Lachnospiraceae bacterium]|nr:S8 family peptidase [Lachnospiraceae bacterium]